MEQILQRIPDMITAHGGKMFIVLLIFMTIVSVREERKHRERLRAERMAAEVDRRDARLEEINSQTYVEDNIQ